MHALRSNSRLACGALLALAATAPETLAGDLAVTVLDGSRERPGGLQGVNLTLEDTAFSGTTNVKGEATIGSVTSGRYVLRVTGPSGFTPVRVSVAVAPSGTVTLPPILLARVPTGSAVTVPTTSGVVTSTTQVESALIPGARLSVTAGTTISGISSDDPGVAIFPVDRSATPVPFPGELEPIRLYAVSQGGYGFSPGLNARLPNDEGLPAGTQRPVYALLPRPDLVGSDWRHVGTATVDESGSYLATDAAFVASATYFAVHAQSSAVSTRYRLVLQDGGGNPLSGAVVHVQGVPLAEIGSGTGVYEGNDVVHPGAPVRALVSKQFGPGLVLRALTDPVHVSEAITLLHRGAPLRLALSAQGEAVAAAVLRNDTTSSFTYLATELVMGPLGSDGAGVTSSQFTAFYGPENLTFAGPAAPLVKFDHTPGGSVGAPDVAPILSFTVLAMDPAFDPDATDPYTTTARITSLQFSLDAGSSWNDAALLPSSDVQGPLALAPLEGSRRAFLWDLWAVPPPSGITGSPQEVVLRAAVQDAPGGEVRSAETTFHYQWPRADVVRTEPRHGATGVWIDTEVYAEFAHDMDPATITTSTVRLAESGVGILTSATVTYLPTTRQARLTFSASLPATSELTLTVTTGAENVFGLGRASDFTATFTTGALAALADDDGDGLLNLEEAALGTAHDDADSDDDGLSDWEELYVYGTSPTNPDTDLDGTLDGADTTPVGTAAAPFPAVEPALLATFVVTQIGPVGSAVAVDTPLSITFNNSLDLSTISSSNITLHDGVSSQTLQVVAQPSPRSVLLRRTAGDLAPATTYTLTVHSGSGAVEDVAGTPLESTAVCTFLTGIDALPLYEPLRYLETLAQTQWETFPLTAPTAKGRLGGTVVIPATRKLLHTETDVVVPGRGIDVAITRTFRSNEVASTYSGSFGDQWFFNYDTRFEVIADSADDADSHVELLHYTQDGRAFVYLSDGGSTFPNDYKSPPGFHDQLRTVSDELTPGQGSFFPFLVQRDPFGNKHWYLFYRPSTQTTVSPSSLQAGDVGYLWRISDKNLNRVSITRFPGNHPTKPHRVFSITDDADRVTRFIYLDALDPNTTRPDLIWLIQQAGATDGWENFESGTAYGRNWVYTYADTADDPESDGLDVLVKVETPVSVWRTEGGSTTVARKSREYTYAVELSGDGEDNLYYDLTGIQDGRGNTTFRAFYNANHDVLQVDYGSGADAGTAIYSWSDVAGGSAKATQVDRNGFVLTLEHDSTTTTGFLNVAKQTVFTQGLHPHTPTTEYQNGEPASYVTEWLHNAQSEIILTRFPLGNTVGCIRCSECGCTEQCIFFGNDPNGTEDDLVYVFRYEPVFHGLQFMVGPRGNCMILIGGAVDQVEDIVAQTPRTWTLSESQRALRDTFAYWFYYDHEDLGERVPEDVDSVSTSLTDWFDGVDMPHTYGSLQSSGLHQPDPEVFFDDEFGLPNRGGNLIAVRGPRPQVVEVNTWSQFASSRQVIESFAAFNVLGQKFWEVEPDGSITRYEWYPPDHPNSPYLKLIDVDTAYRDGDLNPVTGLPAESPSGTGLSLVTTFEWGQSGTFFRLTNPRGQQWGQVVDTLDLPFAAGAFGPGPFESIEEFAHDGNNCQVERQVLNKTAVDLDGDGLQLQTNTSEHISGAKPKFVHQTWFNTANMPVRVDRDAYNGATNTETWVYQLDRKQQLVGQIHPMGNADQFRRDERGFIYEMIIGATDPARAQRTLIDRGPNGEVLQVLDDDGNLVPQFRIAQDSAGYDFQYRPSKWEDELGTVVLVVLDKDGQEVQRKVTGRARSRTDATGSPLHNSYKAWDSAGRLVQRATELFNVNSGEKLFQLQLGSQLVGPVSISGPSMFNSVDNELVYTVMVYSPDSNLTHVCDANLHASEVQYDGADRANRMIDYLGSETEVVFDGASNPIRVIEREKLPDGSSAGTFYTESFYDALNRLVARVSNTGRTERFMYDSRGLLVSHSDAMGGLTGTMSDLPTAGEHGTFPQGNLSINARGNTTHFTYDGLGRLLSTSRDLRQDGTGATQIVGQIVTSTAYDKNGRVSMRVDPNGNATLYFYDHQDRLIRELAADGTDRRMTWSDVGTLAVEVDGRGTAKSYTYDALERPIEATVSNLPQGAGQTTFHAWDFDGLGRRTVAADNDSLVATWFDSMSRAVREDQTIEAGTPRASSGQSFGVTAITGQIKRAFDGVGNLIKTTYPSGQVFERRYDALDRLNSIRQGDIGSSTEFVKFVHAGHGARRIQRDYTPSGGAAMRQLLEYDGDRRVVSLENFKVSGTSRIAGFGYAWDRANNRRWERRLNGAHQDENAGPGDVYRYDSAYRLIHDQKDVADAALDTIGTNLTSVPTIPVVVANASDYVLDAASNRRQTTIAGITQSYTLQANAPTNDLAMNQYSVIGSAVRQHDLVGNLTASSDTGRQVFYDCDNRLVQWTEGSKDVRYRYDADGRRILKQDVGSGSFATVLYFWDGWQTVEETTSAGTMTKRYVWGEGIDECVRATIPDKATDLDDNGSTSGNVDLYYHHNSLGSVVAVTNLNGVVVESYSYTAFGKPTIFDQGGAVVANTYVEQPFMFTGARFDFEEGSNLYQMRLRYYDPASGRFVSRDPLGLWGDPSQNGNGQSYCGHDPINLIDPMGLGLWDDFVHALVGETPRPEWWHEAKGINQNKKDWLTKPERIGDAPATYEFHQDAWRYAGFMLAATVGGFLIGEAALASPVAAGALVVLGAGLKVENCDDPDLDLAVVEAVVGLGVTAVTRAASIAKYKAIGPTRTRTPTPPERPPIGGRPPLDERGRPIVLGQTAPVGPPTVPFDPRGKSLVFREYQLSGKKLQDLTPFDPSKSGLRGDPVIVVTDVAPSGRVDYFIMQGNHRVYMSWRTGKPVPARIYTREEWVAEGHNFNPAHGTPSPDPPPGW